MASPWGKPEAPRAHTIEEPSGPTLLQTGYAILYADGRTIHGQCKLPERPGYAELARMIVPLLDGAEMERVNVWNDGKYTDMFVDELGHHKGLPRNELATKIYRANVLTHDPSPPADPEEIPYIVGTAVVFGRKVWS